jgi:hypothetical protein
MMTQSQDWINGAGVVGPPSRWILRHQSTYRLTASAYGDDSGVDVIIPNGGHHRAPMAINSRARLGHRKHTEVSFPSQKVFLFDEQDRHSSKQQMWYAENQASQPLLMFDGSVAHRAVADVHPGWHPHFPQTMPPPGVDKFGNDMLNYTLAIRYRPQAALDEARPLRTSFSPFYPPFFWFTRGGLKGVDFGGAEVDTRAWRLP